MMSSPIMMSLLCSCIFLVSATLSGAARIPRNPPSAVIVGTVYCDTCFHQDFTKASHFISGASVAVECGDKDASPSFRQVAKTDEHGEFRVHLPFSVSKHVKKIQGCAVKLINSSEPYCAVASTATSSSIHLKSRKHGTHIFSSGFFTFKPLQQPELCNQLHNPNTHEPKTMSIDDPNDPKFAPPLQDPPSSDLTPLPELPRLPALPQLPPLPQLPGLPVGISGPGDEKVSSSRPDFFNPLFPFPPNPLFPPPSLFPPITNPFQPPPSILPPVFPSPPTSIFPPIFPSPPPSIFPPIFPAPPSPPTSYFPPFGFPPLPGLTPSPPPPSSPPFLPLPPFPFQPTPGLPGPGVPPASAGVTSAKTPATLPGKTSP
ncbi:OLC1v1009836C1 [Oldenlandia corymbosa var. corymbosa]|uniref:OLC1v1009836C1 n=1 Tax=Oldenlandia corymbosa var. corymbosa TaxID=529605 RepID=A0AAV1DT21_OLDCO|nr:OLC1v1009836C1 [Oldenlandia corymbosa var. corymbosa]